MSEEIEWEELTEEAVLCFPFGAYIQTENKCSVCIATGATASWGGWCVPTDKTETEAKIHFEESFVWDRRTVLYKARITSKNAPVRLLIANQRPFHSTLAYWVKPRPPQVENKFEDTFRCPAPGIVCWRLKNLLLTKAEAREPLLHLFQLFGVGL